MGEHYVCTGGCAGVSPEAGTCNMESCKKHGMPLTACTCSDGMHNEAFEKEGEEPSM